MKHRNMIALCLVFAAILTVETCIPVAGFCVASALVLTAFRGRVRYDTSSGPS